MSEVGMEQDVKIPEPALCGMGMGAACCIYMSAGPVGICCEARTTIGRLFEKRKEAGQMVASRQPKSEYPSCQLTEEDND